MMMVIEVVVECWMCCVMMMFPFLLMIESGGDLYNQRRDERLENLRSTKQGEHHSSRGLVSGSGPSSPWSLL